MNNQKTSSGSMNHLEKITGRILDEAKEKAAETLKAAEEEIALLKKKAEEEKAAYAAEKEEKTKIALEAAAERNASAAETEKRGVILREKEKLMDEAYARALSFLTSQSDEDRFAFSLRLLKEALREIGEAREKRVLYGSQDEFDESGDSASLILNKKDRDAFGEKLAASCKDEAAKAGLSLSLDPGVRDICGGFLLESGEREINCELSRLIESSRRKTEKDVYAVLFEN